MDMIKNESYRAPLLPLENGMVNIEQFVEELIDATAKLEVYKEKIKDSKLNSTWFMPTLQQKEALSSSKIEGTQATFDGVLVNQISPNEKDKNLNEVSNYSRATAVGYRILAAEPFSKEFFCNIHTILMDGNVRKIPPIGEYRKNQNYIGRNDSSHAITFTPPAPENVPELMKNLISYINDPKDSLRPLVRTAIIHAQFETIHPFGDGNGRVGRMLIPMYLYAKKQIDLPCFFISEALEKDKMKYYSLLNNTREKKDWNSWIRFFLNTVNRQCDKYINLISDINFLYDKHIAVACEISRSSNMVNIIDALYRQPVTTAKKIAEMTDVPTASVNRYLGQLVDAGILYTDSKGRNRTYFYYDLLTLLRA